MKGLPGRLVYKIGEYKVMRMYCYKTKETSYMVLNSKVPCNLCHSHVKTKELAIILAKNVFYKRYPKTTNIEYLKSHLRVSNDADYKIIIVNKIKDLGGLYNDTSTKFKR